MKYNRQIIVFTTIIMLLFVSGCSGKVQIKNITSEYNAQVEKQPEIVQDTETVRKDVVQTKLFGKTKLKYKHTIQYQSAEPINVYQDETGRTYSFNKNDIYISYSSNTSQELNDQTLSEKKYGDKFIDTNEAEKIAAEYAKENFASIFDGYTHISTKESNNMFDIIYEKRCGKDGAFNIGYYICRVLPNSRILYCSITDPDEYKDFDVNRVKDLSKEDFDAVAQKEFEKEYGEKFISFKTAQYLIEKYQDDYIVKMYCNVTAKSDDGKDYTFSQDVICLVD